VKILMYIPQPGPTRAPEVTENLAKLGNNVVAISPPERQMFEVGANIKPIRFSTVPLLGPVSLIGYALILALSINLRLKPDVIYTLGGSMGTGLLVAKFSRRPLITEVNGWRRAELKLIIKNPLLMLISRVSCWMDEMVAKHSDSVIVVADSIKEKLLRFLQIDVIGLSNAEGDMNGVFTYSPIPVKNTKWVHTSR